MLDLHKTQDILILAGLLIVLLGLLVVFFIRRKAASPGGEVESDGNQIYVGNLSYRVRERHLREYFSEFGEIEHLRIIKNHDTGRSKGFGFVTYKQGSSAASALNCHGRDYEGRSLVVRLARPK
jgi:LPXTG-motif cell wall-anchored protein